MDKKINPAVGKIKKSVNRFGLLSTKKQLLWIGLLIAIIAGIGLVIFFLGQATQQKYLKQETPEACNLPKVDFKESAFSIGVPEGWIHEVDNGTVAIMEDKSNTTAAFLYTARLERNLSAGQFLSEFANVFENTIVNSGGKFTLGEVVQEGQIATASADATVEEGDLTGRFQVEKNDTFVTLKVYWAPASQFKEKEVLLKDVVGCFTRHEVLNEEILAAAQNYDKEKDRPVELLPHNGNYFKLLLPSGFEVTGETDSGVDISRSDNRAGFSYAYVTGAQGPYIPQSWAETILPQYGVTNARLGSPVSIPSPVEGYVIEEFDFVGTLAGVSTKGKITVGVYNTPDFGFGQSSSMFTAIQVAAEDVWPKVSTLLQQVQNSVEITSVGSRGNVTLPPNRPMETTGGSSITSSYDYANSVSDRAHENWSEAMRGYEPVESPSTGTKYDAPLNSWNPSGPEGAGYYRALPGGGLEKLSQE